MNCDNLPGNPLQMRLYPCQIVTGRSPTLQAE